MADSIMTEKIGKLGFGYMRLPRKDGKHDLEHIKKMADAFINGGGTYFDAAYVYEGAEVALRESVVKRYPRESFTIATKLPLGVVSKGVTLEDIFKTSLERLGTDYVDFYMLHGLDAKASIHAQELGAWDYLADLKAKGQIRHMGFSFHGQPEDLDEILTKHPEVDFAQLQINYFDWDRPKVNARRLHEIACQHGVPVVVMEPLLGGKLASTDSPIAALLRETDPNASIASWAFRFVAQLDMVFVTLSGMSSYEQVVDNVATYSDIKPLSGDESAVIKEAVKVLNGIPRIACTGCDYCKDCPSNIHISELIGLYNDYLVHKTVANLDGSYGWMTEDSGKARDCTACGTCEKACPQKLEIIDTIKKVSKLFD